MFVLRLRTFLVRFLAHYVSMTLSCAHSCYCVITVSYALSFHCVCDWPCMLHMLLRGHICHCVWPWVMHWHATMCEILKHTLATVCHPKICTCHCVWLTQLHTQLAMVCDPMICTHWPLCMTLWYAPSGHCVWPYDMHLVATVCDPMICT